MVQNSEFINIPPYIIDEKSRRVKNEDQIIDLTSKEFDLLDLFYQKIKDQLFQENKYLNPFGVKIILAQIGWWMIW